MKITSRFVTYRTTGYTHQVSENRMAAGDVHLHQIRRGRGHYLYRIVESNGKHQGYSKPTLATPQQIESAKNA